MLDSFDMCSLSNDFCTGTTDFSGGSNDFCTVTTDFSTNSNDFMISSNNNCQLYDNLQYTQCDYFENYGEKYCNIYLEKEKDLSPKGQQWSQNVRQCLQDNVIEIMQNNPSCSDLKTQAIAGHSSCYLDGPISFCDLPISDQITVGINAKLDLSTVGTIFDIAKACGNQYLSFQTEQNMTHFDNKLLFDPINKSQTSIDSSFNMNHFGTIQDTLPALNLNEYGMMSSYQEQPTHLNIFDSNQSLFSTQDTPMVGIFSDLSNHRNITSNFSDDLFSNQYTQFDDNTLYVCNESNVSINTNIHSQTLLANNGISQQNHDILFDLRENVNEYDFSEQNMIHNLSTFNQGLDIINKVSHFNDFSTNEKIFVLSSIIVDQLKSNINELINTSGDELSIFTNIAQGLLKEGKIKVDQLIKNILETKFNVPLQGVTELVKCIFNHGKNLSLAIQHLYKDCVLYCVPYAQVAYLIYQSYQIIKSFLSHRNVISIHGFSVQSEEHTSWSWSKGFYHTTTLKNEVLGIEVKGRASHTSESLQVATEEFKKKAKTEAFKAYGLDYDFFDPDYKEPDTLYEKYKEMVYLEKTQEYWKEINKLTPEEFELYKKAMFESTSEKEKRIKFDILGKKLTYLDQFGDKDVYHFMCKLKNSFLKCTNNTQRAMFIYSFFFETGNAPDNQYHFNQWVVKFLEFIHVDVVALEKYINYQVNMSETELNKKVEEQKKNEAQQLNDFLISLRNHRSASANNQLEIMNTNEKSDKNNSVNDYSRTEIMIYANKQLLQFEISAKFVFGVMVSSATSNLLFSLVYFDKEIMKIVNQKWSYLPNKCLEILDGQLQAYASNVLANHISLNFSLLPCCDSISDETMKYFIQPNVALLSSLFVSSIAKNRDKSFKQKNIGRQIFDISENVLKTNGVQILDYYQTFDVNLIDNTLTFIDTYCKDHLTNYVPIHDTLLVSLKYIGFNSCAEALNFLLLGSSLTVTFSFMVLSRILREIIFPEPINTKKIISESKIKFYEEERKKLRYLFENFKNPYISDLKRRSVKKELQKKKLIQYDKIPTDYQKQKSITKSLYTKKNNTNQLKEKSKQKFLKKNGAIRYGKIKHTN